MDKLEARSMRAHFIGYSRESLGCYFYLPKDTQKSLYGGRKIQLKESISEEQRVIKPVEPIPPHRSSRIMQDFSDLKYAHIISELTQF